VVAVNGKHKTSWLQVTGQHPRPFKTKKAAVEAFTAELERLTAEGWEKSWGTKVGLLLVLDRGDKSTVLRVTTVDVDGYDLDPLYPGRRMRDLPYGPGKRKPPPK